MIFSITVSRELADSSTTADCYSISQPCGKRFVGSSLSISYRSILNHIYEIWSRLKLLPTVVSANKPELLISLIRFYSSLSYFVLIFRSFVIPFQHWHFSAWKVYPPIFLIRKTSHLGLCTNASPSGEHRDTPLSHPQDLTLLHHLLLPHHRFYFLQNPLPHIFRHPLKAK